MKTDELIVSQSPQVISDVLDKTELIALYSGMSRREASSTRLLAEELLTAAKGVLDVYEGILWMETGDTFSLHLRVAKPFGKEKRERLIALSKSGKVTPPKGLFARLGAAIESFLTTDEGEVLPVFNDFPVYTGSEYGLGSMCTYHYFSVSNPQEKKSQKPTDELEGIEKNIIDAIVDDILVTVQSDSVEIIAVKNLK